MEKSLLHKQVDSLLDKIKEQHGYLKQAGNYSALELDMILQNIRTLYEQVKELEKAYLTAPADSGLTTGKSGPALSTAAKAPVQPERAERAIEIPEPLVEIPIVGSPSEVTMGNIADKDFQLAKSSDMVSSGDLNAERNAEERSLHDKIGQVQPDKSLVNKMQQKSIKDLKAGIGMNEKFMFISQLFGGNAEEYNLTVDLLNKQNSYEQAFGYLRANIFDKHNWDTSNSAVEQFLSLMERRFASEA